MSLPAFRRIPFLFACAALLAGGEPTGPFAPLPEAVARDLQCVVRINDGAWVVDQANGLVGALGGGSQRLIGLLAETFYLCDETAGIALDRPAWIGWRSPGPPLVACIPVGDRKAFFDNFGVARLLDQQLLRINESDGTFVYSQNTVEGLWEYRLLVRDGYAILGRDVRECEALAAALPEAVPGAPPLAVVSRGGWLASAFAGRLDALATAGADGALADFRILRRLLRTWPEVAAQIEGVTASLAAGDDDRITATIAVRAKADSALAAWTARQKNQGSRLLPLVARAEDLVQVHGTIAWQGEIEAFGRTLVAQRVKELGAPLAPAREAALRSLFGLLDKRLGFACAWGGEVLAPVAPAGSEPPPPAKPGTPPPPRPSPPSLHPVRLVGEHLAAGDAAELLNALRTVDQVLDGDGSRQVGQIGAVGTMVSYATALTPDKEPPQASIEAAEGRYFVQAVAGSAEAATVALRTVVAALAEQQAPQGASGVVAVRIRLARLLQHLGRLAGAAPVPMDDLDLDVVLKTDPAQGLVLTSRLPMTAINELLRRSSIGIEAGPETPAGPKTTPKTTTSGSGKRR